MTLPASVALRARILGFYVAGTMTLGGIASAIASALFAPLPSGLFICFPDIRPAGMTAICLAALLPVLRPPRLHAIQFFIYALGAPLLVTVIWLAASDTPLLNNFMLRWWLSSQIPAMLCGAGCAAWSVLTLAPQAGEQRVAADGGLGG